MKIEEAYKILNENPDREYTLEEAEMIMEWCKKMAKIQFDWFQREEERFANNPNSDPPPWHNFNLDDHPIVKGIIEEDKAKGGR